jgi:DNA primase
VLLPYYYEGKIVGSTARKVREGKPKYLSDQHPFFVFNVDEQDPKNKYVFVVEGQFDAYAVGGVGLLTNEISQQQAHIINQLGKEVIVIPDQDKAGLMLIKQAIDYDWAVAFPTWGDDVKDVADAVLKYGKLFVIVDAIKTAQRGEIKISVARNNLETRLALLEEK